jgi:tetratricopeptide (TPR) repeat protein
MMEYSDALDQLGPTASETSPEMDYARGTVIQMVHEDRAWGQAGMVEDEALRGSLEALERAASMRSGKRKYHTALGMAYMRGGKLERALSSFDRSLELGDSALAWLGKASAYRELEMFSDSVRAVNRSISIDPASPYAWFVKGVAEIGLDDLDNAKVSFDRCLSVKDHPAVWRAVAYALLKKGKTDEALTCLDKVIIHHPDSPQAFVEKGITLIEARALKDAIRAFDNALRLDRRSTEAWNGRGITLTYLGKTTEAIKCFREAEKLGDTTTAMFNAGVAYALAEDYVPAVQEFEDVVKAGKDDEAEMNKQHALNEMRRRGRDEH